MTTTGQNFTAGKGDDVAPIFTVTDAAAADIDLTNVEEITWRMYPLGGAVVLTKRMSVSGEILRPSPAGGQFQPVITAANLASLSGVYRHSATVKDADDNTSTVELGKFWVLDNGT